MNRLPNAGKTDRQAREAAQEPGDKRIWLGRRPRDCAQDKRNKSRKEREGGKPDVDRVRDTAALLFCEECEGFAV